ncbi:MAG: TIGR03915 family putative DNA repair protein [Anaerovoracaceae bacterium]
MVDYLYDGTFEGLLTCIYYHYYGEKATGIYPQEEYQSGLLGGFKVQETEEDKSDIVYGAIAQKISAYDLGRIYKVYRSSVEDKETKILNYVRFGFNHGSGTSMFHGHPIVFEVQKAEKKVNNEIHRLTGLIRFTLLNNQVLYSPIEPDHDVVEFLADHFCDRFREEAFIIHDLKREKALISAKGEWYISKFTKEDLPPIGEEEELYRTLWKNYFDTIAIKERTNPRCQKNFMPIRYWKHLTEMQ